MRKLDSDSLAHMVNCLGRLMARNWYTFGGRLTGRWWGVELERPNSFHSRICFRRHPGSRIAIGPNSCFRSSTNRSCVIRTLAEDATVEIGPGCGFSGTYIACANRVVLGKNVKCGADTTIWDTDFHPEDPRSGEDAPVVIGDNVWLGLGVTVLKGVTIGENTIIGAGGLVTRSLPAGVMATGMPARVVKRLDTSDIELLQRCG